MQKLFDKKSLVEVTLLFLAWRIWITIFALLGLIFLQPYSRSFFGGGFDNYMTNPLFWGWSNFDGEHYLSIAQYGYKNLQHSFFPLYPLLVRWLSSSASILSLARSGLIISNVSFLASLYVLMHLVSKEYGHKIARLTGISLLVFPTSFFFGANYTESLFLLLILLSCYLVNIKNSLGAGFTAMLASATRLQGIFLCPVFLWKYIKTKKKIYLLTLVLAPLGILSYLYFLQKTTGSALSFYSDLSPFGAQREVGKLILFPQVFWRYIKILTSIEVKNALYLNVSLEFVTAIAGAALLVWGYLKKLKPQYLIFALFSFVLPTLSGSFSSLPRYFVVIFPYFILLGGLLSSMPRLFKIGILSASILLLAIQTMMFISGYWIA